jgi:pantoate--beta-alanine ligase
MRLKVVRTIAELRDGVAALRREGARIGLVPTMGALHDGHIALVKRAQDGADATIATIFVNPTQFAANEDLSRYPRTEDADLDRLTAAGTDIAFVPAPQTMYPPGFSTRIEPEGPAKAGLEDRFRPGHFSGVATICAKLFLQSGADVAVFGEKDWQQLAVVRQTVRDLDIPITIIGHETIREPDGLALSSRNRYLSTEDRQRAPTLHRVMTALAAHARLGEPLAALLDEARKAITQTGFVLDYLEARDAQSLAPIDRLGEEPARLLVAARTGATRLIDNIAL